MLQNADITFGHLRVRENALKGARIDASKLQMVTFHLVIYESRVNALKGALTDGSKLQMLTLDSVIYVSKKPL